MIYLEFINSLGMETMDKYSSIISTLDPFRNEELGIEHLSHLQGKISDDMYEEFEQTVAKPFILSMVVKEIPTKKFTIKQLSKYLHKEYIDCLPTTDRRNRKCYGINDAIELILSECGSSYTTQRIASMCKLSIEDFGKRPESEKIDKKEESLDEFFTQRMNDIWPDRIAREMSTRGHRTYTINNEPTPIRYIASDPSPDEDADSVW